MGSARLRPPPPLLRVGLSLREPPDPRKGFLMSSSNTTHPDAALSLVLAMVASSTAPLALLDGALNVIVLSNSFGRTFQIDATGAIGQPIFALGGGEWDLPQLRSLLETTASGAAEIEAYEMDLKSDGA